MVPTVFSVLRCIVDMAQLYPQKVAVVLDDQIWTYSELIERIECVARYLHHLNIVQGQIIYQFVERGFEMICGLLGIMYAGGVYCSLNPEDPSDRFAAILEQTQGRYVLVHEKTRSHFPFAAVQHIILLDDILIPLCGVEDMEDVPVCSECGPAYIICTSGTTGRPKAVVHTHKSFSASIAAYVQWDVGMYTIRDQILQTCSSTWILHLTEISLPLVVGGTLVLLRPGGNLDMAYFTRTISHQQVTTLTFYPSIIRALVNYLEMSQPFEMLKSVRNLCTTGAGLTSHQWTTFTALVTSSTTRVYHLYGMSECSGVLGCQPLDISARPVPIGYPLPTVRCLLIDERDQMVSNTHNPDEIGQIHIGGPTLFHCYLNDSERTAIMFGTIDNQVYVKTGDLARYNARGELVYVGRAEFEIKICGQRVETSIIENTIMNWSPSKISNCLVTKIPKSSDLLVAYIASNDSKLDTEEIRDYCDKQLPQYMVPSYFVVLDKFPLNFNGNIDRKQLPLPSLLKDASTNCV